MASQFVSGTYQSYKAGTGKVLNWLYENALKCGYGEEQTEEGDEGEEGENETNTGPEKKLKPKPKSSGKAKSKKAGTPVARSTPKYFGVKEFSALAEASKLFSRSDSSRLTSLQLLLPRSRSKCHYG